MTLKEKLPKLTKGQLRIINQFRCAKSGYLWAGTGVMRNRSFRCMLSKGIVVEQEMGNRWYGLTETGKKLLRSIK